MKKQEFLSQSKYAEQGYDGAQNSLGMMYYEGKGVPKNYVLAHKWLKLSGWDGDYADKVDQLEKQMTPS